MRCVICRAEIKPALASDEDINPPSGAVVFSSYGNYGSTVFDPMTNSIHIEIFICDGCLEKEVAEGNVLQVVTRENIQHERTIINELPNL